MEYVRLGSTGTYVSRLCLGCMSFGDRFADWTIGRDESIAMVRKAIEGGINFFDTADAYGRGESEELLGEAIRTLGVKREEVVLATKAFAAMGEGPNRGGLSRKHMMACDRREPQRLGTDYIDLYQIHRYDYNTPIEETIAALDDAVTAGKLRYIGASSMFAYQFSRYLHKADALGRTRFVTMQNHYSLLYREEEREMNPLCGEEGIGLIPWGPLAGGRLAGNRAAQTARAQSKGIGGGSDRFNRPEDQAVIDRLHEVAAQRGESAAQVAIAWLLSKPAVTAPILGATKLHQLDDPLRAIGSRLSKEEIALLEAPYVAQAVVGAYHATDGAAPVRRFKFGLPDQ